MLGLTNSWAGDISVGYPPTDQGGDLRLLAGEFLSSARLPLLEMLAGGPQLQTRPLGGCLTGWSCAFGAVPD